MQLTEDSFRALARSSPWRWRTLEFIRHAAASYSWVHARVERPGVLRVTDADGRTSVHREEVGAGSVILVAGGPDDADSDHAEPDDVGPEGASPAGTRFGDVIRAAFSRAVAGPGLAGKQAAPSSTPAQVDDGHDDAVLKPATAAQAGHVPPSDVQPARRPDGLVAERPDSFREDGRYLWVDYDDPMLDNYRWVAMLDPVELAAGTSVSELMEGEHRGRRAWFATMTALPGYEPRCGCCSVLWSAVSDLVEHGPGHQPYRPYPDSYRVGLDVQTGVLVSLVEDASRVEIDLEILVVDDPPVID